MTKFTDITPPEFACDAGASCPAVYRSEDGSRYRVQGQLVRFIGAATDEAEVEIPADLLEAALKSLKSNE